LIYRYARINPAKPNARPRMLSEVNNFDRNTFRHAIFRLFKLMVIHLYNG